MRLLYLFLFALFLTQCNNLGKSGIGEETILGRDIFDETSLYIGIYGQDLAKDSYNFSRRLSDLAVLTRWPDAMGVSYQKRDLSFNKKKAKACIALSSSYLIATRDPSGTLLLSASCKLEPMTSHPLP
ncbi:hypothetical protein [Leptospira perdikensis]|uniref:Uncharacterized protein n=1 Tax=Leptospira perdikensis TaxID=2484948 RepID=A0A4R9JJL9_9LEPT|nr:hypothetical protein [Leptospira perdikensis]TGL45187.1 hypothetical protein EHQ49_06955 [Leptospira perdikensis]